jgi:hypothetical protein
VSLERIYELERLIGIMLRREDAMAARLAAVEQASSKVWGLSGGGGTSGGAGVYHIPAASAGVIAAGGSGTADVWQTIGGTNSLMVSGATIYNVMGAATVASKVIMVASCGDGTFKVVSQSCT